MSKKAKLQARAKRRIEKAKSKVAKREAFRRKCEEQRRLRDRQTAKNPSNVGGRQWGSPGEAPPGKGHARRRARAATRRRTAEEAGKTNAPAAT